MRNGCKFFLKFIFSFLFIFAFETIEGSNLNGVYKVFTLNLNSNSFYFGSHYIYFLEIEDGEYVNHGDYIEYYSNNFESLNDFNLHYRDAAWGEYGIYYITKEYVSDPKLILPGVGFGAFTFNKMNYEYGKMIIGETLSETAIADLLKNSVMNFEGDSLTNSGRALKIEFNPQTGNIEGRLGEYFVELDIHHLNHEHIHECFDLNVYYLRNGWKIDKGTLSLMLTQDEENSWVLSGGYVLKDQADLVYLRQVFE